MSFPTITAFYAGLFGLLYVALSLWVSMGRLQMNVINGDGGHARLSLRIRAHANFAEYVPLGLLVAALAEGLGAASTTMHALLLPLLVARLLHPFGMFAPVRSMRQLAMRGLPAIATWVVLAAASAILLIQLVPRMS
ncbi:MAPEG family protein [Mesorhizobium sp. VNQ89]|uniref:MAPEG family protein n=1 Tax=Mesorhizobium quangtriensis TaxID=3157709 RepID=UPI0032B7FC8D